MGIAWNRKLHIFENGIELKHCRLCGKYLPLDNFYSSKQSADGLRADCKACKKIIAKEAKEYQDKYNKEYYQKNGSAIRAQVHKYASENKEKISERTKIYYVSHLEQIKAHARIYNAKNCAAISERHKEYRRNNIERIKKQKHLYAIEHREHIIEKTKAYVKKKRAEKDEHFYMGKRISLQRYRTRKKNCASSLTIEDFKECLQFFDYKDAYTGLEMDVVTQDHVIPMSKGGGYTKRNIVPCSLSVNSSKRDKRMEDWYKEQPFFSEKRLLKIRQWMGYKKDSNILQTALF